MSRILLAGLLIALLAGCVAPDINVETITGSGNLTTKTYDLAGFSQINVNNAAQVEVTRGDAYSVVVEIDDNLESRLEVSVTGNILHIGLANGSYRNFTFRAKVTMPKLIAVTLNGASTLTGELAGEDLAVDLNGASKLTLTGTAGGMTVTANGASRALLSGLAAGDVEVDANGASHIEINTNGAVTGKANGASVITVTGTPTSVSVQTEGAARVVTK
jgi:Putative auto-transporter adhesin, head GIN domain